jgi:hypothetical protein
MVLMFCLVGILVAGAAVVGWIMYCVRNGVGVLEGDDRVVPITDVESLSTPMEVSSQTSAQEPPAIGGAEPPPAASFEPESFAPTPSLSAEDIAANDLRQDEVRQLKEEVKLIREKAVLQARNAIDVINTLREENDRFRSEASARPAGRSEGLNLLVYESLNY